MPDIRIECSVGAPDLAVAGVDEVGRGPLAGPVVAAAVILPAQGLPTELAQAIDDSKCLTAIRRRELAISIVASCQHALGRAEVGEIDTLNILQASLLAMRRAIGALPVMPDVAIIDGNCVPTSLACRAVPVIKGDSLSLSIAAASILAKVARDGEMCDLARHHPDYGWEHNAGYATPYHLAALTRCGATHHHRRSFAPVRQVAVVGEAVSRVSASPASESQDVAATN